MGVHLDGHDAHHVLMQAHQAFHFLHGRRGRIGAEIGIVTLAVLVDLVGHRLETPVFGLDDIAAIVLEDGAEMLNQPFGLRAGEILARNHHMLIERHGNSSSVASVFQRPGCHISAPRTTRENAVHMTCGEDEPRLHPVSLAGKPLWRRNAQAGLGDCLNFTNSDG